jgi:hypothetical protein
MNFLSCFNFESEFIIPIKLNLVSNYLVSISVFDFVAVNFIKIYTNASVTFNRVIAASTF